MVDLNSKTKQQAGDDLTWLARNVHEWPDVISGFPNGAGHSASCTAKVVEGPAVEWKAFTPADGINCFSKQQWLARRTVLQNKPSWGEVESDAEWMAQHPDGRWVFFNREPFASLSNDSGWKFDGFYAWRSQNVGEILGNWRDTLERRPKNNLKSMSGIHSHGDMASLLNELDDNDNTNPGPSNDDWHKRGELPPVGVVCRYVISDRCSCEVEITAHAKMGICFVEIGKLDEKYVSQNAELHRFRPIPTERERVASELVDVMMAVPVSDRKTASESYMSMALAIYDHLHPESKS